MDKDDVTESAEFVRYRQSRADKIKRVGKLFDDFLAKTVEREKLSVVECLFLLTMRLGFFCRRSVVPSVCNDYLYDQLLQQLDVEMREDFEFNIIEQAVTLEALGRKIAVNFMAETTVANFEHKESLS